MVKIQPVVELHQLKTELYTHLDFKHGCSDISRTPLGPGKCFYVASSPTTPHECWLPRLHQVACDPLMWQLTYPALQWDPRGL